MIKSVQALNIESKLTLNQLLLSVDSCRAAIQLLGGLTAVGIQRRNIEFNVDSMF